MRWPLRVQLLLPNLAVATVAILLLAVTIAYVNSRRAQQQQRERLRQTVSTLAEATFPLTDAVLKQMAGLSGAKFVVLGRDGASRGTTLPLSAEQVRQLAALPLESRSDEADLSSSFQDGQQTYAARRIALRRDADHSLVVLYPQTLWSETVWEAAFPPLAIGALAALAVAGVSFVLSRRMVRTFERVGSHAATIASGEFHAMTPPERDDEIRDLALSINDMAARLARSAEEIRRHERLATLDRLSAGMAHQMRNSATGARLAIELHRRGCTEDDESLGVASDQLRLMEAHVQKVLALGSRSESMVDVALDALVDDVARLLQPRAKHGRVQLEYRRPLAPVALRGDPGALGQLVVNLVTNALDAVECLAEGERRVVVEVSTDRDGAAVLSVDDTGPGPAAEVAERLFEPFVTDKPDGTGLGLAVSRQIARLHGGEIQWRRHDGTTRFSVALSPSNAVTTTASAVAG